MFEDNIIKFIYPKETKELFQDVFPIPTKQNIPDWFKKLEHTKESRTIKGCMPFLDSITAGYILRMPQDFAIKHNVLNKETNQMETLFKWSVGVHDSVINDYNLRLNRNNTPDSHAIAQVGEECPFNKKNKNLPFYKIINPFRIETAKGYSCLFVSPLNNSDDRFNIISGIVDTDSYKGAVNFPIVINGDKYPNLDTIIERGTPYVQIIPFKREAWKMKMEEEESVAKSLMSYLLSNRTFIHIYKKFNWSKKKWN